MPEPARGLRRPTRVRRGDERVGAVVDVEQRALRALEQDALAGAALAVQRLPDDVGERQHLRRDRQQLAEPAPRSIAAQRPGRAAARCGGRAARRASVATTRGVAEVAQADRRGAPTLSS